MDIPILGRQIKVPLNQATFRCDLMAEGHNRLIHPGSTAYGVQMGEAQGTYHGPRCYQEALRQYQELKKQKDLEESVE